MSWAGRQRAFVIAIISLVVLAVLTILGFSIFYKTPTCTDHRQNQDEQGIDCGGSCTTLCAAQVKAAPHVRFVRALAPQAGRVDVVAYIENPNTNAEAKDAPFLLEVYGGERQLITKRTVTVDLPRQSSVPVYLPDVAPRGSTAAQAFLVPITEKIVWKKAEEQEPVPAVENIAVAEGTRPRITADLVNPLAEIIYNTTLVATVFDTSGNVLAASQTLVPTLPSQGTAPLVFTWNEPFAGTVARVEILPVPELFSRAP